MSNVKNVKRGIETRKRIIDFIETFINTRHYSPSIREIMEGTGLRSLQGVRMHMLTLKTQGKIDFEEYTSRSVRILKGVEVL